MKWGRASLVEWFRPTAYAGPGFSLRREQGATSGTAENTRTQPSHGVTPPLALETVIHRRAVRMCNRNPRQAAQYVETQTILSKGR